MITGDYVRMMARYGAWQNAAHLEACAGLSAEALAMDRGAFFGSIEATANHLLWGDKIWLSRFAGTPGPEKPGPESVRETANWAEFEAARRAVDAAIAAWAHEVADEDLAGDHTWFSGVLGREITKPMALCVTHFFNHGTHHRGQMHAMLTAAGVKTADTDIFVMPDAP